MTDAELLTLLQVRSPDRLTLRELEWLRQRVVESGSLREELLRRRELRENAAEALARIDVSLDALLAQTASTASARRQTLWKKGALFVALLLVASAAGVWWKPWRNADVVQATAARTDEESEGSNARLFSDEADSKEEPASSAPTDSAPMPNEDEPAVIETPAPASPPAAPSEPEADNAADAEATRATPPVVAGPWDTMLRPEAPLAAFAQVAFQPFRTSKFTPDKTELAKWFAPMNAQSQVSDRRVSVGNCGAISGVLRLLSPWREDAALRFSLEDYDRLKIHFFRGEHGVTLVYYHGQNYSWAAYYTSRRGGAPQPISYRLAATDFGRGMRTEVRYGGPYELRYHNQEIILSRGDVALIRAPLHGPPEDVFFEGKAVFTGLTMVKTEDVPFAPLPRLDSNSAARPALWTWKEQLSEGAALTKHADGAIELTANNAKSRGFAAAPLPGDGLREIVLKIDAATPGAGIFLGRGAEGKPHEVVKFLRDQRTGQLGISMHGDDDTRERHFEAVDERITPLTPEPTWVRLLFGCGILRCWVSGDGVHWAEPFFDLRTHLPGDVTHLGLHYPANRPDVRIRISDVYTRPLETLNALAEANLLPQALALPQAFDYGDWLTQISAAQPPEVDTDAWRRACAVKTLAAGAPRSLGDALVNALLDDAAELPVEEQLAVLQQAALLLDLRSDHNHLMRYLTRYSRLAERAHREGHATPFSLVRHSMMTAPIATPHHYRLSLESLVRKELLEHLNAGRWRESLELCDVLRFYRLDENLPLATWARATAQRQLPDQSAETLIEQRDVWRHPLVEELSKEAYNFLAEFQALLEGEAFDDAARMIAATELHTAAGVAADRRDPRLLVSLPAAIRLALRDWAELRSVMENQYADLAELRVRRAISQGDEEGVRSAALQFDATPAAALAARWMGDRALSRGHFEQALALYDRAARTSKTSFLAELAPRQRLAGAMLGRDVGSAVAAPVELGDVRIAAEEFETLVKQMRERAASAPPAVVHGAISGPRVQEAPAPRGYASRVASRLEGPAGSDPHGLPRPVREANVDWVARQLAWVIDADTLYVNNRFHVAAYDVKTGERRWQSPPPPGKGARAHEWSLVPMRPLVTDKHLLTRQLTGDGPVLVCLDKQNGQVVWTSQPPQGEWLISDPLAIHGRLVALRMRRDGNREATLVLCDYDSSTGELRDQQELLRMREPAWTTRYVCQVAAVDDALVAVLGGCVVCADLTGGVRWIRRQLYVPPEEDPASGGQRHEPPLAAAGRLFLSQPGVRLLECVDADTGRSYWTRILPDLQGVIGLIDDCLIVETDEGFLAVDPASGKTIWRRAASDRLEGRLCGGAGGMVYVRAVPGLRDDVTPRPELVWLDAQTGEECATLSLHNLKRNEVRFGPLVAHQDRLWGFVGAGPQDPHRDLVELTPQGDAEVPPSLPDDPWLRHVDQSVRDAASHVLTDWRVFRGIVEKHSGLYPELHGEQEAFSIDGSRSQPVVFARRITIPQNGRAKLRMRLAMDQLRLSQLQVEFQGESLFDQKLDDQTLGSRSWRDFEADLSSRAGQTGWLTVRLISENDQRFTSFWKRLEVAF